jgi:tRNA(fMet)-specific endonuclease VapC
MFCLDTNVVIGVIASKRPRVVERLEVEIRAQSKLLIPVIVLYELRYGAAKSDFAERNRVRIEAFLTGPFDIVDFTSEDAAEAGDIRAGLERSGTPIGPHDILIAAQARRRGARLVTSNMREFARVSGLLVEDWAA